MSKFIQAKVKIDHGPPAPLISLNIVKSYLLKLKGKLTIWTSETNVPGATLSLI